MARILLIEDELELRTLVRQLLTLQTHEVIEAEDGRCVGHLLNQSAFDLVITDMLMPERDGVEVIQTVRRLHPRTRILAMSGGGRNSANLYLRMAEQVGAHRVIGKPFTPEELLEAVGELVG